MDPSAEEFNAICTAAAPLQAMLDFIGMSAEVRDALFGALGGIQMMRELVFISLADWQAAVDTAQLTVTPGTAATEEMEEVPAVLRTFSGKEKAQARMLRRYTRLLAGLPGSEDGGGQSHDQGQQAVAGAMAEAAKEPAAPGKRKFRMSVVDQRDDQEVEAMEAAEFRAAVKRFKEANDGLNPAKDEESTMDQLKGIATKLTQDVVPYADFGVLRPFGLRLERSLKFHAKFWDPTTAELVAKKLPRPPNPDESFRA